MSIRSRWAAGDPFEGRPMTNAPILLSLAARRRRRARRRVDTATRSLAERLHLSARSTRVARRGFVAPSEGAAQSWWPWDSDKFDEPTPDEATVSLNALTRRVTLRGDFTTRPALALLDRVFDFLIAIRPGPSSIDMSRVSTVDVDVLRWLSGAHAKLAAFGATLTVIDTSSTSTLLGAAPG